MSLLNRRIGTSPCEREHASTRDVAARSSKWFRDTDGSL
jgi:hypothetical protein